MESILFKKTDYLKTTVLEQITDKFPEHISMNKKICAGEPILIDTRIPVHNILELLIEHPQVIDIVLDAYPHLSKEQITVALEYAVAAVSLDDEITD